MIAQTCPVCGGNGLRSEGFYSTTTGMWSSNSTRTEPCRSCDGRGYVVVPHDPIQFGPNAVTHLRWPDIDPVPTYPPRRLAPTTIDPAGTTHGDGPATVS